MNDFAHGGYEMDDTETGVMMVIATVVHLPFQVASYVAIVVIPERDGGTWDCRGSEKERVGKGILLPSSQSIGYDGFRLGLG